MGTLPNVFYEASITLVPKPDKGIIGKKNQNKTNKNKKHTQTSAMNIEAKFSAK